MGPGVCETEGGTVAGNALAEVIFALADATIERKLHQRLVETDFAVILPCTAPEVPVWDIDAHIAINGITCRRIAYVDDAVVPLVKTPLELVDKLAIAVAIARDTYFGEWARPQL